MINIISTIIPIGISIIAIILTLIQISLSNKQALLDRRIYAYIKFKGLYELWERYGEQFFDYDRDEVFWCNRIAFVWLTNNGFLYGITSVIETLMEDDGIHKKFLLKLEELEILNEEISFIFKNKNKVTVSLFVKKYCELLRIMTQYQDCINKAQKLTNDFPNEEPEEVLKTVKEEERRKELFAKYEEVNKEFMKIRKGNLLKKMKHEINLHLNIYF